MVEWIFAHFSGCEAPSSVASGAIGNGNLRVLLSLRGRQASPRDDGQALGCTVQMGRLWDTTTIQKACDNGQLSQCLDDGMQLDEDDHKTAIKCALELGNFVLAERLLPAGKCLLDCAAGCPRVEVIEWMLDCGFLQRDGRAAAMAMPGLASSGRLELMKQVRDFHSPLSWDRVWVDAWIDAIKEACSSGDTGILQWLLDQSVGVEACDHIRSGNRYTDLLVAAAERGHAAVMESLYRHQLFGDFRVAMAKAVEKGQLNSLKWLQAHYPIENLKSNGRVIDKAVQYGQVEILQFLHEMDAADFEASGPKRRRTNSWWSSAKDPIYWAARGGHLAVLEWIHANKTQQCREDAMDEAAGQGHLEVVKWLHANRSEGCTSYAMDCAASNGHLEMVKWLHANRSEGCTYRAMYEAAEHGHLEVVKWLYGHRPNSRTPLAINAAVRSGHLRIVRWLQTLLPDYKIRPDSESWEPLVDVDGSWDSGKTFEALLFLHVRYGYVLTPLSLERLRTDLSLDYHHLLRNVESWLDEHYPTA
jgi:hypothetical protein